uniref:Putative ovule protein n=1 Tax=Solanum chacoense TaxID=4108 RepID=A0A0V0HN66_SOLCH
MQLTKWKMLFRDRLNTKAEGVDMLRQINSNSMTKTNQKAKSKYLKKSGHNTLNKTTKRHDEY